MMVGFLVYELLLNVLLVVNRCVMKQGKSVGVAEFLNDIKHAFFQNACFIDFMLMGLILLRLEQV